MTYRGIDADIGILRKAGVSDADIVHFKEVSDKAVKPRATERGARTTR